MGRRGKEGMGQPVVLRAALDNAGQLPLLTSNCDIESKRRDDCGMAKRYCRLGTQQE